MYRTMPGGDADLKRIRDRAYRYYMDRANERLRADNLAEAESEAQAALVYQPSGQEAKTVIQTVKDRREAAVLIARGRTLLGKGDAEEALANARTGGSAAPVAPGAVRTAPAGESKRSAMAAWSRAVRH